MTPEAILVFAAKVITLMRAHGADQDVLAGVLRLAVKAPGEVEELLTSWYVATDQDARDRVAKELLERVERGRPRSHITAGVEHSHAECVLTLRHPITREALPRDTPGAVACLAAWTLASDAERAAYHRCVCLGSRDAEDQRAVLEIQTRIERVIAAIEGSAREGNGSKENEANGAQD